MISVQEAQEIINQNIPERKQQILPLKKAFGYTTAEDIYSRYDIPNFSQSSMDGYAIRFEDKNLKLKIAGEMPAGSTEYFTLENGTACRIFTGAPLPDGADTVVMQEKVSVEDHEYLIIEDPDLEKGMHVRDAGSDAQEGSIAISSGNYLSAAAIGYLAGIGCTEVKVYAAPSVSLILTGNELVKPGENLDFGQVFESNSYQLESVLKQCGIETIESVLVKDDLSEVSKALHSAILKTDIVILVGGVSVGDYDYVIDATRKCGVKQRFHKIRQKPGKPFFFGTKEEKLVFGLPGNPSSALTCFYVYIAPLLSKIMMRPDITAKTSALTTSAYQKKSGLMHFLKATHLDGQVTPLHAQESYRLQSFAEANCLMILKENSEGCGKDEAVEVIILK
ncbi:molybdopterin molybdotransferase MoeA [Chryseobacterium fluminis]|uniref:molybdopterin molybdotransferase MoeA n=1 Tax=Chryseobacterium fluminis TaxID=2983606 RepID=UPI00224E702B|nr:gephyrin-like molybdotransferase Glp [Chryseobacterium sp. MMS21-Ot14]UZT99237.1 molybdopterin molybdotransferase MoeA [Chryseobacterium sp. MMS21-Ot14]